MRRTPRRDSSTCVRFADRRTWAAAPLSRIILAVVFCCAIASLPSRSYGDEFRIGVEAQAIWDNDHGVWVNLRLRLTTSGSDTFMLHHEPEDTAIHYFSGPPTYCDHLVLENLEEPQEQGICVSLHSVYEDPHDTDSALGRGESWNQQISCAPDSNAPGMCDSALYYGEGWWEATVQLGVPENCGVWRVHYLVDGRSWTRFCYPDSVPGEVVPEIRTIVGSCFAGDDGSCARVDSNLLAYIYSLPAHLHTYADINLGTCPEPPPPPGETSVKFEGYLNSNGDYEDGWLPTPGDSIGLVFQLSGDPPHQIGYQVWDISMWQGECMNSPRYLVEDARVSQPEPITRGFEGLIECDSLESRFPWWDFTLGQPCKWGDSVHVRDTVTWRSDEPYNWWLDPGDTLGYHRHRRVEFPYDRPLYLSSFWVGWDTEEEYDTLWLRCHDYGAHCLVTPIISGKIDSVTPRHMDPWETLWGEHVWTITVPYDYDGYTGYHFNYGDGMNDYWEMDQFAVNDSRPIRPFVAIHPVHGRGSADYDPEPVGRDIDGDSWCNFAEYRGVIVREDSTFLQRSDSQHVRLDPVRKTVLVHVRGNMNDDLDNRLVLHQMPGLIYKLQQPSVGYFDSVEIYFTDSIRFRREYTAADDQTTIERERLHGLLSTPRFVTGREVNFNRVGAGLWYYGFGAPIRKPMAGDDTVRAVTFWKWDANRERAFPNNLALNPETLGHTWGLVTRSDSFIVPNYTYRIVLNTDNLYRIRRDKYRDDPLAWFQDYPPTYRRIIGHEFGHAVGMKHLYATCDPDSDTIMSRAQCYDGQSHFVIVDSVFADSSKDQFTAKRRRR